MMANTVSRYLYGLTVNIVNTSVSQYGRYIAHYYRRADKFDKIWQNSSPLVLAKFKYGDLNETKYIKFNWRDFNLAIYTELPNR